LADDSGNSGADILKLVEADFARAVGMTLEGSSAKYIDNSSGDPATEALVPMVKGDSHFYSNSTDLLIATLSLGTK
jgi:hypothetical protein